MIYLPLIVYVANCHVNLYSCQVLWKSHIVKSQLSFVWEVGFIHLNMKWLGRGVTSRTKSTKLLIIFRDFVDFIFHTSTSFEVISKR